MSADVGAIALFVGLIGYLIANRVPLLRRYRWIILGLGVLLFLVSIYVDWDNVRAAFMKGYNDYR